VAAVAYALTWNPGDEVIPAERRVSAAIWRPTWKTDGERAGLKHEIISPRERFINARLDRGD